MTQRTTAREPRRNPRPQAVCAGGGRSRIRTWEGVADGFTGSPLPPVLTSADLRILPIRMGVKPRSVRVASVVPECAWSARRICWIMSHEVRLSPTTCIIARCSPLPWRPSLMTKETRLSCGRRPRAGLLQIPADDRVASPVRRQERLPAMGSLPGYRSMAQVRPLSGSVCMSGREPGAGVPPSPADGQRLGSGTSTWRKVSKSSTHLPVPSTTESSGLSAT